MARIYFASDMAKRKRHYREGQELTLDSIAHERAREIEPGFWQFDLDSTGTCYIHVSEAS